MKCREVMGANNPLPSKSGLGGILRDSANEEPPSGIGEYWKAVGIASRIRPRVIKHIRDPESHLQMNRAERSDVVARRRPKRPPDSTVRPCLKNLARNKRGQVILTPKKSGPAVIQTPFQVMGPLCCYRWPRPIIQVDFRHIPRMQ